MISRTDPMIFSVLPLKPVETKMRSYRVEPSCKSSLRVEVSDTLPHADESLLHRVLRLFFIAQHLQRQREYHLLMRLHYPSECLLITLLTADDDVAFCWSHSFVTLLIIRLKTVKVKKQL